MKKKLRDMLVPLGEMVNEQVCPYTELIAFIDLFAHLQVASLTYLLPHLLTPHKLPYYLTYSARFLTKLPNTSTVVTFLSFPFLYLT